MMKMAGVVPTNFIQVGRSKMNFYQCTLLLHQKLVF